MKRAYVAFAALALAFAACKQETTSAVAGDTTQASLTTAAPAAIQWKAGDEDREALHQRLLEEKTDNSLGLREIEAMLASQGYSVTNVEWVSTLPDGLNCHCDRADVTVRLSKSVSESEMAYSAYTMVVSYGAGHQGFDPNAGASISSVALTYNGIIRPAIEPRP
jgi:hypothetical protein